MATVVQELYYSIIVLHYIIYNYKLSVTARDSNNTLIKMSWDIQSTPPLPNTAALGTGKKTAVLENGGKGCLMITKKKNIRPPLKSAAVLGGGGNRGDDCTFNVVKL